MSIFITICTFTGCAVHTCLLPNCDTNKDCTEDSYNYVGKNFGQNNKDWSEKMTTFLQKNKHCVDSVEVMEECVWRRMKKEDKSIQDFLENIYVPRPLSRLQPAQYLVGGRVSCYALRWNQKMQPTTNFHFEDLTSSYGFVMATSE